MDLEAKIEALLFARGEPIDYPFLTSFLKEERGALSAAVSRLRERYSKGGITVVDTGESVALRTSPEASSLIERIRKDELDRELSKAAQETLAIVLYAGPVTRATIDFIRGVNSTFILRALLVRGLIERAADEKDERRMLYRPTIELLAHLGLRTVQEIPGYVDFRQKLEANVARASANEAGEMEQHDNL